MLTSRSVTTSVSDAPVGHMGVRHEGPDRRVHPRLPGLPLGLQLMNVSAEVQYVDAIECGGVRLTSGQVRESHGRGHAVSLRVDQQPGFVARTVGWQLLLLGGDSLTDDTRVGIDIASLRRAPEVSRPACRIMMLMAAIHCCSDSGRS